MKFSKPRLIIGVVLVIALGYSVLSWTLLGDNLLSPIVGETKKETTSILGSSTTKEIMLTNGLKHSVPLGEIVSGGPPKDGIPPIDDPKFVSVGEADEFLNDEEPGISLTLDGVKRFYPFQIMVWHEIVNDTINGKRVL